MGRTPVPGRAARAHGGRGHHHEAARSLPEHRARGRVRRREVVADDLPAQPGRAAAHAERVGRRDISAAMTELALCNMSAATVPLRDVIPAASAAGFTAMSIAAKPLVKSGMSDAELAAVLTVNEIRVHDVEAADRKSVV